MRETECTQHILLTLQQTDQLPSSSSSSSPERHQHEKESGRNSTDEQTTVNDEDNLIPLLSNKLKAEGFEPQLKWLQKQLLEAAYVKLGMWFMSFTSHQGLDYVRNTISQYIIGNI